MLLAEKDAVMTIHTIAREEELGDALARSHKEPVVLYKHSRLCELCYSARAGLVAAGEGPPIYEIVVQDSRPLSNHIEAHFGIRHESPQIIAVSDGAAVYHASHRGVTPEAVRRGVMVS